MDVVFLIGRILFALVFVSSGVTAHLVQRRAAAAYARSLGTPAAELGTVVTGVVILVAGILVVLGLWMDLAALGLIAFLLSTNVFIHKFWALDEPMERMTQMTNFMKNTALIGGALVLFYVAIEFEEGLGLSIEPALFD